MAAATANNIQFAPKFRALFQPARYKVFYGGRGGGKSHAVAVALLAMAYSKPVRVLCAREYQVSIADSVHKLLCDKIVDLGLSPYFTITKANITSVAGSEFIFKGLHHNISEIKSLEGIDYCWCFPAGTLIDGIPIEEIKKGDSVLSYNHETATIERRKVLNVMRRKAPEELYRLTLHGLNGIIATPEHPFYVKGKGYIPICEIKKGDVVYACEERPSRISTLSWWLWNFNSDRHSWTPSEICQKWRCLLLGLCQKAFFRTDEKEQPHEFARDTGKNVKDIENNGASPDCSWWKWQRLFQRAKAFIGKTRSWLVARISCADRTLQRRKQPSILLQDRCSEHLLWNSNRSGWWKPCRRTGESRRSEKRFVLREQRVDSVEIQKQTSLDRNRFSDGGNYVYNLEVEGNNNYFANQLLVHNCEEAHSISRESWELLIPTIRKEGSEIWLTFNPMSPDDETYKRFVVHPPAGALVVKVGWQDNPWFPKTLHDEMERCKEADPEGYAHIWGGEPRTISDAQIFKGRFEVRPFETPDNARFFHGCDWGFASDPSVLIRDFVDDGYLYLDAEAYGVGVELDETPALFDTVPTSRTWPIKADNARPETISYMARKGFRISAAKKWPGSVLDGIALLKSFKKIIIHPRCKHAAEEFRMYSYKVDRVNGDILPIPASGYDHVIDAVRYSLDGYVKRSGGLNINQSAVRPTMRIR